MVVAGAGELVFNRDRVSVWEDEKFWRCMMVMDVHSVTVRNTAELYT